MENNNPLSPFALEALKSGQSSFISPYSGKEVSSLKTCAPSIEIYRDEYYIRDPFSSDPFPPFEGFVRKEKPKAYLTRHSFIMEDFPRFFGVRGFDFEELWKVEGPNKLSRVFRRKVKR